MAQNGWTKPSEEEYRAFAGFDIELIKNILSLYLLSNNSMSDVAQAIFSDAKDSRTISQITRCLGFAGKNEYTDGTVTEEDVSAYVELYYPGGYREETQPDFDALVAERQKERKRLEEQAERERKLELQRERERELREREAALQEKQRALRLSDSERTQREEAERAAKQKELDRKREMERISREAEEQTRIQKLTYEWHKISAFLTNNNNINALDESMLISGYDYLYDLNYTDAVNNYGWFFHNLSLKTKAAENKAAYLVMAAKANYPMSMNDYGVLIESGGHGRFPDPENALAWYEGAAERGNEHGNMNAGRLLFERGDFKKSKEHLEKIKDKFGDFWIKKYWAKAAIRSACEIVTEYTDSAGKYYDEVVEALTVVNEPDDKLYAAQVLFFSAIYDFMDCYKTAEHIPEQSEKQKKLFSRLEKASEYGLALADTFLGDYYYYMNADTRHIEKARRHYSAAAENGNARAAYMLAKTYLTENVYPNSDVVPLMEKSAALGYRNAELWLRRNFPQKPAPASSNNITLY